MNNKNKKPIMFNNINSDFDKEVVEIKLFFGICNARRDCNLATLKLELFGNILLVTNANDLKH